jgi:hypothetical protein
MAGAALAQYFSSAALGNLGWLGARGISTLWVSAPPLNQSDFAFSNEKSFATWS